MNKQFVEKASAAIADKYRLAILLEVAQKGILSCTAAQELTGLSQPCVSHHLKLLTESRLLTATKEGRFVTLRLNKDAMKELSLFFADLA